MKKEFIFATLLFSASAIADPTMFGGNMYSIPVSSIDFEGLSEVATIFSADGKLVAVLATLPKDKFDYLNQVLSGKYKMINEQIPFVGNKSATYRDGGAEITLQAPHMSFEMSMNYINDDLMRALKQKSENEQRQKRQSEASQL